MNPFDFVNSICYDKRDLLKEDPSNEKEYNAFIINRGLSYYIDTVMFANEMNLNAFLSKTQQYQFLLNSVSKKKRFSKWAKKEVSDNLQHIIDFYKCSRQKALSILNMLSSEQIEEIKRAQNTGGKQ